MRMRMADGFEHFQLPGFNDGDGLRADDGREALEHRLEWGDKKSGSCQNQTRAMSGRL